MSDEKVIRRPKNFFSSLSAESSRAPSPSREELRPLDQRTKYNHRVVINVPRQMKEDLRYEAKRRRKSVSDYLRSIVEKREPKIDIDALRATISGLKKQQRTTHAMLEQLFEFHLLTSKFMIYTSLEPDSESAHRIAITRAQKTLLDIADNVRRNSDGSSFEWCKLIGDSDD